MNPKPFHVVFCGTSEFAVASLTKLAADEAFSVDLVVTQPARPVGRKQVMTDPPVKDAATKLGLKVFQPEKLNKEWQTHEEIFKNADFLVVVAYGQILSQEVLDLPKIMPVNVHGSVLPAWRGASPIQHAILNGDKDTGVTIQKMVKELDAGPILCQSKTPLGENETFQEVHDYLATLGAALLVETLKKPLEPVEQDVSKATFCKKLEKEDGLVDPQTMTAQEIHRKVLALNPWPGVTCTINGETIKILTSSLVETKDSAPLACKDGSTLHMKIVVPAGRNKMSGKAWSQA